MTPGWKQLSTSAKHIAGCMTLVGTLSSCATNYQSPLSQGLKSPSQAQAVVSDGSDATRLPSGDANPTIEKPITFDWPVDSARMTRGFLPHKRHPHLGIDLAAPKGTPIMAAQSGTVIYTGREFRGYGKMVLIESGEGWATLYAHFDKILVSEGQRVRQGEVIGAMGRTGHATGVHLHFEIRKNRGPVDPLPLLPRTATARN
jgi:murein DD-endopeptidase MepM/ murein hydrolase activator NlpD